MALWPVRAQAVVDAAESLTAAAAALPQSVSYTLDPLTWSTVNGGSVSRADALAVPGVTRSIDLMASTVGSLPIEKFRHDGGKHHRIPVGWLETPETTLRPRFNTLVDTCRDLILEGAAYWLVNKRDATGKPAGVVYAEAGQIGFRTDNEGNLTGCDYKGRQYRAADIIQFHGHHDGIRHHGANIIRTALALENAAKRYAETPLPSQMIRNVSNYEMSDEEIAALLADVKRARQESAIGYLNAGAELQTFGFDPGQMQLVEARMYTNAAIANLCGIPQHFLAGSNPSGSSLTYANVGQENRGFVDYSLRPLLAAIEQRLSMDDITPHGQTVRFSLDNMLRGNPLERATIYAQLIPAGVLTVEEAREWEDLVPDPTEGNPTT